MLPKKGAFPVSPLPKPQRSQTPYGRSCFLSALSMLKVSQQVGQKWHAAKSRRSVICFSSTCSREQVNVAASSKIFQNKQLVNVDNLSADAGEQDEVSRRANYEELLFSHTSFTKPTASNQTICFLTRI
ncbi:MAG: hypothetical protein ACI8UO_003224 [Verrucomicrobiales bacterium]|jgi:hypothetical protein